VPPLSEDEIGRMVGDGAAALVARAFKASGVERPADALDRFVALYGRRLLDHTRPYPGVPDLLERLQPGAALAVLTNKPLAATHAILDGLDLARFFSHDAVIGGDGPLPRKPNPAGLQHIQTAAAISAPFTLLVGDSVIDWRTAKSASTSICVARYGFGFQSVTAEEMRAADFAIDAPMELLERLGLS
jgi:phosphoglycolate phosphatase